MTLNAVNPAMYPTNGCYTSGDDYFGLNSGAYNNPANNNIFPSSGGYSQPMMPGMGSVPQSLWNDPKAQMDYQYDMNNSMTAYGVRGNAQQLAIGDQCAVIAGLVSEGKEDEILGNFKELESTLKSQPQFERCTDKEIKAYAKNLFQQTTGVSLTEAIKQNCKSDFSTGLTSGFHFGNADKTSKQELLAEINGTKPPMSAGKAFGAIIGAIGGVLCLGIPGLIGEHG